MTDTDTANRDETRRLLQGAKVNAARKIANGEIPTSELAAIARLERTIANLDHLDELRELTREHDQ